MIEADIPMSEDGLHYSPFSVRMLLQVSPSRGGCAQLEQPLLRLSRTLASPFPRILIFFSRWELDFHACAITPLTHTLIPPAVLHPGQDGVHPEHQWHGLQGVQPGEGGVLVMSDWPDPWSALQALPMGRHGCKDRSGSSPQNEIFDLPGHKLQPPPS